MLAGVDDLFVHTMAVNEGALRFYDQHGFAVVAEESANCAHYRHAVTQDSRMLGIRAYFISCTASLLSQLWVKTMIEDSLELFFPRVYQLNGAALQLLSCTCRSTGATYIYEMEARMGLEFCTFFFIKRCTGGRQSITVSFNPQAQPFCLCSLPYPALAGGHRMEGAGRTLELFSP